jgi:gliding-associated putative ABC transporter substrate-binding component GldG
MKKSFALYIFLITGITVLVNILANRFYFRIDLTEDSRYTLSDATRNILKNLDDPVTVTAYFSEGLPPDIDKTRRDFRELLSEYASRSGGKIVYEFVNPNKNDETEQVAYKNGISPVMINVREKDQSVQKKAFLGALLKYGEKTEVIPFIQPGSAMEYSISSAIRKMISDEKNLVGFIQGHGEPTTTMFAQAMEALGVINKVEGVNFTDSTYLARYKTLVIAAPTDSFPAHHLAMLDDYLAGGGNLVVAINRVNGDLQRAMGMEVTTGLESWLEKKGIRISPDFIVDANCGSVSVVQQQGFFSITSQLSFPYLPIMSVFADHPVTSGLEAVVMQFASPVTYTGDSTLQFTPLVMSSDKSGTQSAPLWFNIEKKWGQNDFPLKKVVAGALLEGKIAGANHARMIIFGDGDFAVNGPSNQGHQLSPDNVNLLVNSIDWLSDDTGLIGLRTRGITSRTLDPIEDGKKNFLKWFNLLLPVALIILYGFFRMQRNRLKREKRKSDDYNR